MSNKLVVVRSYEILKKIINAGIHCIPAITDSYFVVAILLVYSISVGKCKYYRVKVYEKRRVYIAGLRINY